MIQKLARLTYAVVWLGVVWPVGTVAADTTYTILNYPYARQTAPTSIDANGVAGSWVDNSYTWRGFYWTESGFKLVGTLSMWQTIVSGTSGSNVVGRYQYIVDPTVDDPMRAFYWNGSTITDLIPPGATSDMDAVGISGNLVVGSYRNAAGYVRGFLWNGSTYTSFDALGASATWPRAISGNNVAGDYSGVGGASTGFFWDGSTFTQVKPPDVTGTRITSLHGHDVVGYYTDNTPARKVHGFLWNGSSYITIDPPGATQTFPTSVFESKVVGYYSDGSTYHGFLWNGLTFTILDVPGSIHTNPKGIWGNRITGSFTDALGVGRGFVTSVPEPFVEIGIGSTNVFAGQAGKVPLVLSWGGSITNVSVILACDEMWFTNLLLQSSASEVISSQLEPLTTNHVQITLNLNPAVVPSGRREVAQLGFLSLSNGYSAMVPLTLSHPAGIQADGKFVGQAKAVSGRIIMVDQQPVLTVGTPPWMSVGLYGYPGVNYDLESTTTLPASSWQTVTNVTLPGPFMQIDSLGLKGASSFYRARQR